MPTQSVNDLKQVLKELEAKVVELEQKANIRKRKIGFEPPQPYPGIVDEDTVEQERAKHEWAKFFSED